jgi:hypothetical protein
MIKVGGMKEKRRSRGNGRGKERVDEKGDL